MNLKFWKRRKEERSILEKDETGLKDLLLAAGLIEDSITRIESLNIPTLAGCVELISSLVASIPIKLYKEEDEEVTEIKDDIRLKLLNEETGDTLTSFEMKKALVIDYLLMGNECITQAHDVRAALANYDKAIELYPEYIDAWIRKGITLFNEKEFFDAENCLNRAVSLRPSEFKALYNRGKLRLQTENIEGALSDLDKATSLKPEHPGAHELFGDALLKVGKETEAAIQWRIAEELRKKKK